jgi:Fur family ferric uptake transcriptional regulator
MVTARPPVTDRPRDEEFVARALARAVGQLRAQGHRVTGARRAVIETLARHGGHPNAAELSAEIELRHPGVHLTTVYRTLEFLAEQGVVTHVHMGHGATAFHLAGSVDVEAHLHARCRICGRVLDLPADLLDPIRLRLADERDFVLDPRHVALSGACQFCHDRGESETEEG